MSEMNEYTPELYELEDEYGNKRDFEMVTGTFTWRKYKNGI